MRPQTQTRATLTRFALAAALAMLFCAYAVCQGGLLDTLATIVLGGGGAVAMAVSASQIIKRQDGERGQIPVAASTFLYEGTICFITAAGYADDDTAVGVNKIGGIVVADIDNSSGANGDLEVEVFKRGEFVLTGSGFAQSDVNSPIYASDNYTVTTTSLNNTLIGVCTRYVSATKIVVALDEHAQ